MTVGKSQPRSLDDVIYANWLFDLDSAAAIISAVGLPPDVDMDAVPDAIKASQPDELVEETLLFHLRGLAKQYRWDERLQNLPAPKEIAQRTRKIADLCRQICDAMLDSNGKVIDGLGPGYLFAAAALSGEKNGAETVQSTADGIRSLKSWAICAADRADSQSRNKSSKRGRRRDKAFHDMLDRLGGIYFYLWKRVPGRSYDCLNQTDGGPYFRFALAVVTRLCPEWAHGRDIEGALAAAIAEHSWPRGLWGE